MKKLVTLCTLGMLPFWANAENWQMVFADPKECTQAIYLNKDSIFKESGLTFSQYLYVYVGDEDQDAHVVNYAFNCGKSQYRVLNIKTIKNGKSTTEPSNVGWISAKKDTVDDRLLQFTCSPNKENVVNASEQQIITLTKDLLNKQIQQRGLNEKPVKDRWQMLHSDYDLVVYLKKDSIKSNKSVKSGQFLWVHANHKSDADLVGLDFLCSKNQYRFTSMKSYKGKKLTKDKKINESWYSISSGTIFDSMKKSVCSPNNKEVIHSDDMFKLIEGTKKMIGQ